MFTEEYKRKWKMEHPDRQPSYEAKWVSKNREKNRAQQKARYAIGKGRLTRQPCEECGNPKSEMHHHDYSKPLDVTWLCHHHHFSKHKNTMPITATTPVKEFLRRIGSKGGKKSALHPDRRKLNKQAAEARWRQRLPQPKEVKET